MSQSCKQSHCFLHIAGLLLHASSSSYSWPSLNQLHHMWLTRISAAVFLIFLKNFKFTHSSNNDTSTSTGDTLSLHGHLWHTSTPQPFSTFSTNRTQCIPVKSTPLLLIEVLLFGYDNSRNFLLFPCTYKSLHEHSENKLKLWHEPTRSTPCSPSTAGWMFSLMSKGVMNVPSIPWSIKVNNIQILKYTSRVSN